MNTRPREFNEAIRVRLSTSQINRIDQARKFYGLSRGAYLRIVAMAWIDRDLGLEPKAQNAAAAEH